MSHLEFISKKFATKRTMLIRCIYSDIYHLKLGKVVAYVLTKVGELNQGSGKHKGRSHEKTRFKQ